MVWQRQQPAREERQRFQIELRGRELRVGVCNVGVAPGRRHPFEPIFVADHCAAAVLFGEMGIFTSKFVWIEWHLSPSHDVNNNGRASNPIGFSYLRSRSRLQSRFSVQPPRSVNSDR